MIAFDKIVAQAAWPLAITLSTLMVALIVLVVGRRAKAQLESRVKSQAASLCQTLLDAILVGAIRYQDALVQLRRTPEAQVRASLTKLLTSDENLPRDKAAVLRNLCEDFGLVDMWRRSFSKDFSTHPSLNPFGPLRRPRPLGFVRRAEAAEHLGAIRHKSSWRLLVDALNDPNGTVQSAAARSLARIGELESFRFMADRLESASQDPSPKTSVRSLTMALGSFPVSQAGQLRKLLEHWHPRGRLAASVVVGLMAQHESAEQPNAGFNSSDLSSEVAEIFLTRLAVDEDSDVRARAADVLAYLEPFRAIPVLMSLLCDSEWFVRLHATRALGRQQLAPPSVLSQRLTDPHWRVREAASETLAARGRSGLKELFRQFLTTADRYGREQVVEQIERADLFPSILEMYAEPGCELETRFVEEIVLRGLGGILLPTLQNHASPRKLRALARRLLRRPNVSVDEFMSQLSGIVWPELRTRETWAANESEPAAAVSENVPAVRIA